MYSIIIYIFLAKMSMDIEGGIWVREVNCNLAAHKWRVTLSPKCMISAK